MSMRRMIPFSSALLVLSALALAVPGCGTGGGEQSGGGGYQVKVNTAPGVVPPDQETSPPDTRRK